MQTTRRSLLAILAAALFAAAGAPPAAAAPSPMGLACAPYGDQTVCSGEVKSFDGTSLDVDVTLPQGGGAHPLMVMLHGFGNTKHEWESTNDVADDADKWHWNSHWFASHGYYVLTYKARGFHDQGPDHAWQPKTPSGDSGSPSEEGAVIRLKSKDSEIKDTQWLAGLLAAAAPDLDRSRVAVTGGSYGGGESWLQATEPVWAVPGDPTHPLTVQVAVPKYGWTDLAYSLAPNGHGPDVYASSTGAPVSTDPAAQPLGVEKLSYVSGFYALGLSSGRFEEGQPQPGSEPPYSTSAWNADISGTGDPYDAAPVSRVERPLVAQARLGLTQYRGAYYQAGDWAAEKAAGHEVAVFAIQGWTDDLFPAVESFREFKALKALDPLWPVEVAVADVGHPRAQNKPATWHRLNDRAWGFLQSQINGSHRERTGVSSEETVCGSSATPAHSLTAPTPEELASGSVSFAFPGAAALVSPPGAADPNGPATDPVIGSQVPGVPGAGPCRTSPGDAPAQYTVVTPAFATDQEYVGIAQVRVPYVLAGNTTAALAARLWDVAPDGTTYLVTRGAYRVDTAWDPVAGTLSLPFFGNEWVFQVGHRARLDLTLDDTGTFRPTAAATLAISDPVLTLPVRSRD